MGRTLLLEDTPDTSSERFQEPSIPPSSGGASRVQPSGQPSGGEFRFQEPSESGPPIDDMALGLAEVQDLGERVGGLAWLGLTFWVNLPGSSILCSEPSCSLAHCARWASSVASPAGSWPKRLQPTRAPTTVATGGHLPPGSAPA